MLFAAWELKTEIGVGDLLTALGFVATAVGLIFAYGQLSSGVRDQRAHFLLELTERYFADKEIRAFYYKLENENEPFLFDPNKFHGSPDEPRLDQLLYTFDVIGRVVRAGSLTKSEAQIFAFQAEQVLNHPEVIKYLAWLDRFYEGKGLSVPAHEAAKYLVETLKTVDQRKPYDCTAAKNDGEFGSSSQKGLTPMQNFEKQKVAAIMDIVYRTAEPEWKGARAAQRKACPTCGSIVQSVSEPHPAGEGTFEYDWAAALVKYATGLVGNQTFKEIANVQLAKLAPKLWTK